MNCNDHHHNEKFTRRDFLTKTSLGLGALTLGSLINPTPVLGKINNNALNFNLKLINLKREKPEFKNLKYKKILKYLSKLDNSKSDIGLCSNKKIFETGTSNLLFVKDDKFFSPIDKFYKGITYKFFKSKIKKITRKDIFVNNLKEFDEIILIGSGKGVASVKTISQLGWQRKSLKNYNILSKYYKLAVTKCKVYR